MHAIVLLAFSLVQSSGSLLQSSDSAAFSVQTELQARYDEISQAQLQFLSDADVDNFHDVMYTSDWSVTDIAGHRHDWPELRAQAVQALTAPLLHAMVQSIQKLSVTPAGAVVTVNLTTERNVVDAEGHYGKKGDSHSLNETTPYRDTWVMTGGQWRLKAREQIGQPKVVV